MKARRGATRAIPESTNGAVEEIDSKSRKGRPANSARIQQDLSMVAEAPSIVYPDIETAEDSGVGGDVEDTGAGQAPIQLQQNHKSPGGLSTFSGTTARISFPAQELTEVSPEDMLDTLLDLSDASERFLSFVIPVELSEASVARTMTQLQNKNTRENKKLQRLADTFERQRKDYGGDSYIDLGETLRRLLGRKAGRIDEQSAAWRPDPLLQKANLATLVSRTLSVTEQHQYDQFLEDIAGIFPQPFLQGFGLPENLTPECSSLAEATFQVALEVRTQEAIMLLARHEGKMNFDPDTVLLQIFYDANDLKGWVVSGLRTADLKRDFKDIILGRVEKLRKTFKSSGVESLRMTFPWTTFAKEMIAWVGQRLTEIDIQTTTYGGAQAICQRLIDVIQSGRLGQSLGNDDGVDNESNGPEIRLEYDTSSVSRATSELQDASTRRARADELNLAQFSANSNKVRSATAYLKQRQANRKVAKAGEQIALPQNQESAPDVQVASTAGPSKRALTPQQNVNEHVISSYPPANVTNGQAPSVDQDDNWRPEEHEEERDKESAHAAFAYRTQREAESNKENVAEIPESQYSKNAKKRSIYDRDPLAERVSDIDWQDSDPDDQESELSSEEGFQNQAEPSSAAMQRRLKPATKRPASKPATLQRRSPKKVRVQENVDAHTLNGSTNVVRDERETEVPLSQEHEEYVRMNISAKQNMAMVTKPPQKRSAWTAAETDTLLDLITTYGTSWKLLKEQDLMQGHVLEARDQVALKDKARNMKMDYLKANRVLPMNFDRIPLSKPQIERLRGGGIQYDPETGARVDAVVDD